MVSDCAFKLPQSLCTRQLEKLSMPATSTFPYPPEVVLGVRSCHAARTNVHESPPRLANITRPSNLSLLCTLLSVLHFVDVHLHYFLYFGLAHPSDRGRPPTMGESEHVMVVPRNQWYYSDQSCSGGISYCRRRAGRGSSSSPRNNQSHAQTEWATLDTTSKRGKLT